MPKIKTEIYPWYTIRTYTFPDGDVISLVTWIHGGYVTVIGPDCEVGYDY